ncbi:MAG: insulinase family protein [Kiritimatiellae bacterium]|nr:insulinase family protein [Kiritimatiellia bacterium]
MSSRRFKPLMAALGLAALAAGCQQAVKGNDLKVGDCRHGFVVKSRTALPEVGGRLWRLTYEKNGAEVAWLDRADENKTFGVAFRTLPTDDTGVAHILEHSVLCGSAKYPVKEPFVDLLKSSLATFLNAFTSKDQTVYPVSSRNDRDFLNLVDVYLDAVFHPRSVTTPVMFQQEGWHYEFGKDGALLRNGVVYNEMKGVYANPESIAFYEICKLLFPDNLYRFVSGGDPAHIGELTFRQYCDFYHKHYHPSNARIFLDGSVDLDATLAKLDSYLADFDARKVELDIPDQKPVARSATVPYAIGKGESPAGKTILADAWVFGRFDDTERQMACSVLLDALAGSNESPLKKRLLESGLCEDVDFSDFSFKQQAAFLFAKNVPDGKADEFRRVLRETLTELAQKGLDHPRLTAILDRREFQVRELFSGGGTCGLKFLNMALDQWLYDGDPAKAFQAAADFASLRAKVASGWFERFLDEMLISNTHHAQLTMTPSATVAAERMAAEKAELAKTLASWDAATKEKVKAETAAVDAFRNKVDTPAELATLPTLALADIPVRGKERQAAETTLAGVPLIRPAAGAKGVFYLSLRFSVDDFSDAELAQLPFLATVLGELATKNYDALALRSALDTGLGRFATSVKTYAAKPGDTQQAKTVFVVDVAGLDAKTAAVADLVPEVLLRTKYADASAIADLLKQERLGREREASTIAARMLARRRAAAAFSAKGAVEETLSGLAQLRHVQAAEKDLAADAKAFLANMENLAKRVFARSRLTVYLSDNVSPSGDFEKLVDAFPGGVVAPAVVRKPFPRRREGFSVASESAYAAKASHLAQVGAGTTGSELVAARLLSLTYLWDEIRVKGGAYGGGLQVANDGHVGFLSWRDPQPARSLDCYAKASAALRKFAAGDELLDRYVVGTLGVSDPCLTPREEVSLAADLRSSGRTYEDLQRLRGEILATKKGDLAAFADVLDKLSDDSAVCVIGGTAGLAACSNKLESVEAVVPVPAKR